MEVEEYMARIAGLLSQAMNALSLVESATHGITIDGPMLHQMLNELIPELEWLEIHRADHQLVGLQWPEDAHRRIARLSHELRDWDLSAQPTPGVLASAAEALRFARGEQPAPPTSP